VNKVGELGELANSHEGETTMTVMGFAFGLLVLVAAGLRAVWRIFRASWNSMQEWEAQRKWAAQLCLCGHLVDKHERAPTGYHVICRGDDENCTCRIVRAA